MPRANDPKQLSSKPRSVQEACQRAPQARPLRRSEREALRELRADLTAYRRLTCRKCGGAGPSVGLLLPVRENLPNGVVLEQLVCERCRQRTLFP